MCVELVNEASFLKADCRLVAMRKRRGAGRRSTGMLAYLLFCPCFRLRLRLRLKLKLRLK